MSRQETIGCGYSLSVMDGKARAMAAAHGVTLSELGFVDPFYAYYASKVHFLIDDVAGFSLRSSRSVTDPLSIPGRWRKRIADRHPAH